MYFYPFSRVFFRKYFIKLAPFCPSSLIFLCPFSLFRSLSRTLLFLPSFLVRSFIIPIYFFKFLNVFYNLHILSRLYSVGAAEANSDDWSECMALCLLCDSATLFCKFVHHHCRCQPFLISLTSPKKVFIIPCF
jgi:hypothetical protein